MATRGSDGAELCLRPGSGHPFSQSGQLDWVAFLKGTAEATVSILTRFSASGVDPMTVLVAQHTFSTLRLTLTGQDNVAKALSQLKVFSSFGSILWFGFGVQHLIRSLAQTREGIGCVAFCGALAECYSEEVAARILSEFVDLNQIPRELSPSLLQWRALVAACAGCLAKSEFSSVVQKFRSRCHSLPLREHRASDPQDVGKALHSLAMISLGRVDSISLSGGLDCAWLGAVAEWLLGLSVTVQHKDESVSIVYGTYAVPNKSAQVRIVHGDVEEQSTTALAMQRNFKLRSFPELVAQQYGGANPHFTMRIPWNTALRSTFGDEAFDQLTIELSTVFTTALASVACIFEHIVKGNPEIRQSHLSDNMYYTEGSFGRGLLNMVPLCFPEISTTITLRGLDCLSMTYREAGMTYESAMFKIAMACGCGCNDTDGMRDHRGEKKKTCLTGLFEAIVTMTRVKTLIANDSGIMPTQSGLYALYRDIGQRSEASPLVRVLKSRHLHAFELVALLYCGGEDKLNFSSMPACSVRGLCFWLNSLIDVAASPAELSLVHIVPGSIFFERQFYSRVDDGWFIAPTYQARRIQTVDRIPNVATRLSDNHNLEAIVTETEFGLQFTYKISSQQGTSWVPPAMVSRLSCSAQGQTECFGPNCPQLDEIPPIRLIEGEGCLPASGVSGCVHLVARTSPAWWIALASVNHSVVELGSGITVKSRKSFLRQKECISCCLRTAMKFEAFDIVFPV